MEFRKKIEIPKSSLDINHKTKLFLLGSCFTDNIGSQLYRNKFPAIINPFGALYNPDSIRQALNIILDEKDFSDEDVFFHQGTYHTFFHHSEFSGTDKNNFLESINLRRVEASQFLKETNTLFVTFGTAYVFKHVERNQIVANCHKLPASCFDRYRINVNEIVADWSILIEKLKENNRGLKIVFTVSPIRHWKDGAHNNQISKSILLLAIDELLNKFTDTFYFPAYEIVLDELRDYRFYCQDMLHPNDLAVGYIEEVFGDTYFSDETKVINKQWQKILKAINHRPFNPDTDEHKQFLRQTLLKLNELQNKYPYFDCENEIQLLKTKLY